MLDQLLNIEFLGINVFDEDFFELFIRVFFNLLINFFIIRFCYQKERQYNSHVFSFYVFSMVIFFVCYLMSNVKLDFGVAFGLFAIFSILRYRTDTIPIREMTYLFIVMGVSVINALSNKKVSYSELVFTNLALFSFIYILETYGRRYKISSDEKKLSEPKVKKKDLVYGGLEHIRPELHHKLIDDLVMKTGLDIVRIEIQSIDFPSNTAQIRLYHQVVENED
ncbi:MAG: DUF4956 domain-containing protein [Bacteroidetes bacterium]|nr:DUF4956 domain-containing protein [Bacteroidota bacterium]